MPAAPERPQAPPGVHTDAVSGLRDGAESRNFSVLVANAILFRIGWVFKTESVIIPAFLDGIAGAGWMRGLLPVLNRVGQSIPPVLASEWIGRRRRKRGLLCLFQLGMGVVFLAMAAAAATLNDANSSSLAWTFLGLYLLFFAMLGVNGVVFGTLQGKLIRPTRRGALLAVSTVASAVLASGFALWLMRGWLELGADGWPVIFGFTGVCFVVASGSNLLLSEWRDPAPAADAPARPSALAGALAALREDRAFRRLILANILFSAAIVLVPHYQALARERLGLAGGTLMEWVVWQNLAVAGVSVIAGPLADRFGNRNVLAVAMALAAAVPGYALWLSTLGPERGGPWFAGVFAGLGILPVIFRLVMNFILELADEADHPRYLAVAGACSAAVIASSPAVGWALDRVGYETVFTTVSLLVLVGAFLTARLEEPRFRRTI